MDSALKPRRTSFGWQVAIDGNRYPGPFFAKGICRDGQEVIGSGMTPDDAIEDAVRTIRTLHGDDVPINISQ